MSSSPSSLPTSNEPSRITAWGAWGILGTIAVLLDAIIRLTPIAMEPIVSGIMEPMHWMAYIISMTAMAYMEGYRGFQCQFSPRVVARAVRLHATPWWCRWLAPVFCMGLIHATRRRLMGAWGLVFGIVAMVIAIRWLPQPLRGAVDAGVVVGLSWGVGSLLWHSWRMKQGRPFAIDPGLPSGAQRQVIEA